MVFSQCWVWPSVGSCCSASAAPNTHASRTSSDVRIMVLMFMRSVSERVATPSQEKNDTCESAKVVNSQLEALDALEFEMQDAEALE